MKIWIALALGGALLASLANPAQAQQSHPRIAPKYKASPVEVAFLPKYCYHQYVDQGLDGPKYSIPFEYCGYEMNHFCPALVALIQSNQMNRPPNERRDLANQAIGDINYTIRGMKPGCYIAADVKSALNRAVLRAKMIR